MPVEIRLVPLGPWGCVGLLVWIRAETSLGSHQTPPSCLTSPFPLPLIIGPQGETGDSVPGQSQVLPTAELPF